MTKPETTSASPKWTPTTKMVIGLTLVAFFAGLLIYFRHIIGPLLLALIIAYLLYPIASRLSALTHLSFGIIVNLIYLILIIIMLTSSTLTGIVVVQEAQSLIGIVQKFLTDLPSLIDKLSTQSYSIGPFVFHLSSSLDLTNIGNQLISGLQGTLGRIGSIIGTFASATASTMGWALFIIIISYFVLADAKKVPGAVSFIDLPGGYKEDVQRIGRELGRIWNAFLRGQISIVLLVMVVYTIFLSAMGVRYALAIAILAGLARFVPWIGPATTYVTMGLVTLFQWHNYFGLATWQYALLVIVASILLDQVFDNLVAPRVMGQSLGVHPAAVLVVAIIATNLIGIIGLVLAAPALASVQLIGRYILRKMFDLPPWPEPEGETKPFEFTGLGKLARRARLWWKLKHEKSQGKTRV